MKLLVTICIILASAQAFQKIKWMDPTAIAHRPSFAAKSDSRIISGRPALEGEVPYQAGVVVDHSRFCGGSLISTNVVLTSASCIEGMHQWEIYLGTLNLVGAQKEEKVIMTSSVAKVHEDFDIMVLANAIGLIKLPSNVPVTDNIRPIRLPRRSQQQVDLVGATAVISGWGITMQNEAFNSPYLKVANVTVIKHKTCEEIYGADHLLESMFCLDTRQQFLSPCLGDAGSPIAYVEADGEKTLLGIANWGSLQECSIRFPEIGTRIDGYLEWLATNGGPSVRP